MQGCDLGGSGFVEGVGGAAATTFAAALRFLFHSQCLLSESWPKQADLKNGSSVDVIIVGAGTAGSALAARLADGNLSVLLLEAGPNPPLESIVPGFTSTLLRGEYDWNLTTVDDHYSSQELRNHRQRLRTGRILGGGGSINHMIYSRGFPADYDQWAELLKDPSWNYSNVLPYFKKTENLTDKPILNYLPSQKCHGHDGDIEVAGLDELNSDTKRFLDGFLELGFNSIVDRNNPDLPLGAYHLSFTIKDGKRQSSLTAMLNKVAKKENLYVLKEALVTKVLIKNNTAYGVKVLIGDEEWEFHGKEVIVSAGVYNTPKILMLSGIGPKDELEKHGIEVVEDLPVGRNLHDHLSVFKFIAAESGTCPTDKNQKLDDAIKYLYNRKGSLSIPSRMGVDYALKNSSTPYLADFSIFPNCVPKNSNYLEDCLKSLDFTNEACSYLDSLNKEYELFPVFISLRNPKSRGTVTLASANPLDDPIIKTNAFEKAEDLEGYVEVFQVLNALANTSYFRSKNAFVVDLNLESCKALKKAERARCEARGLAMSDAHAVGSAALGAVLDARLRVRGVRGLRVADASAMPRVPRENINAVVVMLAERAADFIKEDHSLV